MTIDEPRDRPKQTNRYIICTLAFVIAFVFFKIDSHYIMKGVNHEIIPLPEDLEISMDKKRVIRFKIGNEIFISKCRDNGFCINDNIDKPFIGNDIVFARTHRKQTTHKNFNYGIIMSGQLNENPQKPYLFKTPIEDVNSIEQQAKINLLFARLFLCFLIAIGCYGLIGLFKD